MAAICILLGLAMLGIVAHGVHTGTLRVKGGISRARFPKGFWYISICFAATGVYFIWLGIHDFAR